MLMKKALTCLALGLLPILVGACTRHEQGTHKMRVMTTLFPTYDFAREIAGDRAEVKLLLPPGMEAHTFEPKPEDLINIKRSDVLVYTNEYMEPWVKDLTAGVVTGQTLVIDAGKGVKYLSVSAEEAAVEEQGEAGHHHDSGADPHIWLSIPNAEKMVDNIAAGFALKDPANRNFYLANAESYKKRLSALDLKFSRGLSSCRTRMFLHGGHFAFGYLAQRYGLRYISAYGVSANAEPTPRKLAELIDLMRSNHIRYIFYEELISPAVAETIAKETGATLLKLHSIGNVSRDERDSGVSYISLMEKNLEHLRKGLECR